MAAIPHRKEHHRALELPEIISGVLVLFVVLWEACFMPVETGAGEREAFFNAAHLVQSGALQHCSRVRARCGRHLPPLYARPLALDAAAHRPRFLRRLPLPALVHAAPPDIYRHPAAELLCGRLLPPQHPQLLARAQAWARQGARSSLVPRRRFLYRYGGLRHAQCPHPAYPRGCPHAALL